MVTKCLVLDCEFFGFELLSCKCTNDANTGEVLLYYGRELCFCLVHGFENFLDPLEKKDRSDDQERQGSQRQPGHPRIQSK